MLLLIQNESGCSSVLWAWWLTLLNLRGRTIPLYSFAESLVLWDALWYMAEVDSGRPSQMVRAGSHLVLQLSLYLHRTFSWITQYCFGCPVSLNVFIHQGHLCSAHLQRKKNVQEGSNVRGKEHRLHALESDTVALLCCLIAMKITFCNNKNLYLGWLIHQPMA